MTLVRPRLTDYHDILCAQAELDFAIPFLDEDIPLYVDPFLLWKSPSLQDQALHAALINSFNHLNALVRRDKNREAVERLVIASECDEVGLGLSRTRKGQRIGQKQAEEIIELFRRVPRYAQDGFSHCEEIQLYVDGISKDRISDFACSFLKSFLIDFTYDQCEKLKIPIEPTKIDWLYDYKKSAFLPNVAVNLPVHPKTKTPILFTPKRWLRFTPWISFEDYFKDYCPHDDIVNPGEPLTRPKILNFNRDNYGIVETYLKRKEATAADCKSDPLFKQIPVLSAKRKLEDIKSLQTGKGANADKEYENLASQLMASLMYPHLDFADTQSRTDSGVQIRDLIFYNNKSVEFLSQVFDEYGSRQLVFELKNVKAVEREHINQLNRYLADEFGRFGIILTRNPIPKAMLKNTIDLWAGQRRCILVLDDRDLELMVTLFEGRQRAPFEVIKKKHIEFKRACPS